MDINLLENWFVTYRGVVLPKHCDHYGHLNVRYYAYFFDDGGFQMWHHIGIKQSELKQNNMGAVVANISIDFIHEITVGQLMEIRGVWRHMGNKSMSHEQRLFNVDTGVHCATQTTSEVYFDMKKRCSAPMPENLREKVKANIITQ
ncbi:MAG: acyl-CoA thioesterase [Rhodospirillales bacterium]|mgnify:FL=1|jgi:acyl-CoA thioester hydrolase|nr:acyl-CoA thioesterase [Rhodospirillales bacterium]MDC0989201.1 thioesterase family protein [Rhodospirillales bacterium]